MSRLANDLGIDECEVRPADYFDLMGGVGFGGYVQFEHVAPPLSSYARLAALALGHLGMNVEQAIDALLDVATAVFPPGADDQSTPETNTKKLKKAVEDMVKRCELTIDTKLNDKRSIPMRCKV